MTIELWLLLASLAVYSLYLSAQSLILRWRFGIWYAAGARDDAPKAEGDLLGRAERALRNFNETYVPLVILLIIAHLVDRDDPIVLVGAAIWFAARIVYLPLYLFGIFMVRSLVWLVSATGLLMMFLGILF